ncbi:GH92 family glycosyl hydrolase [Prevotella nanceiensis]|uniref:GH92 family glycosyl hydrolase n=1 Tax=Hoylesella nanceiensis TaxID=425941 RepID=UPI001C5F54DD|nr:GH92 family glycosyl hydrolase [Hoylesella nanceiensis]MBW4835267.1 GH92 family glycosyl hydrolase [Hoylesella nanceiensis]
MNRKLTTCFIAALMFFGVSMKAENKKLRPVDYVNPFIGTTNFGTTNPGAVMPNGLMSVVPFNVMGSNDNKYDKDTRWWSTPYEYHNVFFTGFSHVNLSGVGCPDVGSLLLMPTTGELNVDYNQYGSTYKNEVAHPGYYSNTLTKYGIKTEVTADKRSSIARFTFPQGQSHILLNLGEGLTNESGAFIRRISDNEFEGMKVLGTFCYNPQAVFPIYFYMKVNKQPKRSGYWKMQRLMSGVEAEWDKDNGKYKLYTEYKREIAGDDIGVFIDFDTKQNEEVEVLMGVSFVSMENARLNAEKELAQTTFDSLRLRAEEAWNNDLSKILVEGGSEDQKTVFYTALYHTLIHPNILQDVNGQYPTLERGDIASVSNGDRYTVFSLWDTYRNVHQLLTLVYPVRQQHMLQSMLAMYDEHGWLPKWELYGRETYTMEGDPSIPVIVDSWLKGLRGFDINKAYEAMRKGATTPGPQNKLRPDNDDYMKLGYVPLREQYDNSVSHALEYYIADNALSRLAKALGKDSDAKLFYNRSLGYKHYYSKEYGTFRPILPSGKFYSPFNPLQGENFEPNPGFHEGNAWNYTFYVPHDIKGLTQLMGGSKAFVDKLQMVFDKGYYDPANEPDIAYPHLFSYFKGEEWRTQKEIKRLLNTCFKNAPDGIPGNDDTGTMSAWAVFNMIGFYPDCPGEPAYTLTTPVFDKVTIKLSKEQWGTDQLVITSKRSDKEAYRINNITVGGKQYKSYRISHKDLINARNIHFDVK